MSPLRLLARDAARGALPVIGAALLARAGVPADALCGLALTSVLTVGLFRLAAHRQQTVHESDRAQHEIARSGELFHALGALVASERPKTDSQRTSAGVRRAA